MVMMMTTTTMTMTMALTMTMTMTMTMAMAMTMTMTMTMMMMMIVIIRNLHANTHFENIKLQVDHDTGGKCIHGPKTAHGESIAKRGTLLLITLSLIGYRI